MSDTDDKRMETTESKYEFGGHTLTITLFKYPKLGVASFVWAPGIVLCQYFDDEKINFAGKKIIELGSGTGIVGIMAVLLGGDVTFTDRPYVLQQIERNIADNIPSDSRHRAKVGALMWGTDQENYPADFDIVLGSDIIYSPTQVPGLLKTLTHLCGDNTSIYLCSNFPARVGSENFHKEILPKQFNSEFIHSSKGNHIYKLTKKSPEHGD
ncbi:EEF1A lysine methyltransferase 3-like [Leucoraja erinacea]|uniref:EEF1A lysine methyltransferase 3-like n=1 Tax=Leucoraja erinaceus TaxID=7782 RepID=UPI0024541AAC|nr:EEF1A lysine methyltransferase 3-like [Leucoraja erinacea]